MKNKLIKIIATIIAIFGLCTFTITPAFAAQDSSCNDVCCSDAPASVKAASGCSGATSNDLPTVIQQILNIIIGVLGIVAVIVIVYGGFQYMTSTGDTSKLQKAKNTILYAVIGLIVCAVAFMIVNLTISIINSSSESALVENSIAFLEKTL